MKIIIQRTLTIRLEPVGASAISRTSKGARLTLYSSSIMTKATVRIFQARIALLFVGQATVLLDRSKSAVSECSTGVSGHAPHTTALQTRPTIEQCAAY